jgi:superoxide reductase
MKINKYQDINDIANEAKKDLIDRHSPFIKSVMHGDNPASYEVKVQVGNEYTHPDDHDHYVSNLSLYNGTTKLAETTFYSGAYGGMNANATVIFDIVLDRSKKNTLTAHAYCTKHGVWEGDPYVVEKN